MKLIIGLGNPGLLYRATRHNVGFWFVDEVAKHNQLKWVLDKKNRLEYAQFVIQNEKVWLLKPLTFMNDSGRAVQYFCHYYQIPLADVCVVYDDLDTDVGSVRMKPSGSSGGHKGMQSIIEQLGTSEFKRIRIGISKSPVIPTIDYVLGKPSVADKKQINEIIKQAPLITECFVTDSFDSLMNRYNEKKKDL
ncbi:MAG: aminoacyl-tRNA hydrolase [Bacilli bacterium]|jgi:PTH1 family peptidyl-tRNA hydrolase|nr:aminoacyl-tRNA hydrolase [Bacilli bacterium]MDY0063544.1 aminoacyl-tRNA hydrolase [Bacilli bacterium]